MAVIDSYDKFKEYCLRRLGKGAIVVNVTEEQTRDRIEDALQKWQDFHFEGAEPISFVRTLSMADQEKGYIEVEELQGITEILTASSATRSNAERMDDLDWQFHHEFNEHFAANHGQFREMGLTDYHISMEYLASMRYLFTADRLFTYNATTNRLYLNGQYSIAAAPGNVVKDFDSVDPVWTATNGALTAKDTAAANGNLLGSTMTDSSSGTLANNLSFTHETGGYMRGKWTGRVALLQGTYTGKVKLILKDRAGTVINSKEVQPTSYWEYFYVEGTYKAGHINDFVLEIETVDVPGDGEDFHIGSPQGFRNNWLILVGHKTAIPDDNGIIWNNGWLKDYATALIQKQWAQNLSKFDQVQMAGGVTLNQAELYERAMTDLERLDEDLDLKWGLPPAMIIG